MKIMIGFNHDQLCTVGYGVTRCTAKNCKRVSFPNFSRADDTSILDLLSFEFDSFSSCTADIDYLWKRFKDLINECIERFVPRIVTKSKGKNRWISRETLQFRRRLRRLKNQRRYSKEVGIL